jgi:predicted N-acyltransferase
VNFMKQEEVDVFKNNDYILRETIQYRFTNFNNITNQKFTDFDDYLNSFKSKRRIKIKAERRKVYQDQGLTVKVINGADEAVADADFYRTMFELYTTTIEKMWGSQYLKENFFEMLYQAPAEFKKHLVFIVAYDAEGSIVAGTINAASESHFYGRYWGAFQFFDNLHFEVCYYKAIEYCIDHGIKYMEPGAGGGSFKFLRGFDPYIVNSMHWFGSRELSRAVGDFLAQERSINQATKDELLGMSADKKSQGVANKKSN